MFTGIIEEKAKTTSLRKNTKGDLRMNVKVVLDTGEVDLGESISVNGVCLTVSEILPGELVFDVVRNTLKRTNLSHLSSGEEVNIETALKVGDKLGGHYVSGHIDGTRKVLRIGERRQGFMFDIATEIGDHKFLIPRASVAVDGVSLTVGEVEAGYFRIYIIPVTLKETTLKDIKVNDIVNIEFDMMAKYAVNALKGNALTMDKLRESGFVS